MADEIVEEFLIESREGLERIERDLVALEEDGTRKDVVDRIFRDVHTIKGVCGFLGYESLEGLTHASESLLSKLRTAEVEACEEVIGALLETVDAIGGMLDEIERTGRDGGRAHTALIARLGALQQESNVPLGQVLVERGVASAEEVAAALAQQERGDPRKVGEILVRRNQASPEQIADAIDAQRAARVGGKSIKDQTVRVSVDLLDELMELVDELSLVRDQIEGSLEAPQARRLDAVTTALQRSVVKTRMQPIGTTWGKFPRIVRDLAHTCHKEMRLEMLGRETELDKTILEAMHDPLIHLVRNACDHGVEMPDEREQAGKPREGVLTLCAYREGGQAIIEVSDDGKGIDAAVVKATALERGLLTTAQAEQLGEHEALDLIFLPGFSTAPEVTHVSGRGVGMDVVKTNVERIGGTIELASALGRGTTMRVKIPLTLATIPAPAA